VPGAVLPPRGQILGYDKLNKWLSLLLVTASKDPSAPALMQAAIARGRLMEVLGAGVLPREEHDNLFITGAFSLLDKLLGAPMDKVLEEMTLPDPITDALLGNDGAYTPFLKLARACESFDPKALQTAVEQLHLASNRSTAPSWSRSASPTACTAERRRRRGLSRRPGSCAKREAAPSGR
jgi:c-di-GMP-related signal transduction protein